MRIGRLNASSDYGSEVEMPVQQALAEALRDGDVFFDIGANVGFFTLVAARCVGPEGRLHAFEPRASNVAALRSNLQRNGLHDVRVWPVAVGAQDGTVTLLCDDHPGGATVEPSAAYSVTSEETVDMVTVDHLVETGQIEPPSVVKIDVEGAELAVLQGMTSTIRQHRPVIVYELDSPVAGEVEERNAEITALFDTLGYGVERLPDSYEGIPWHVLHAVARPAPAG
jgi:FkbM family methyltransferase